ncbi:MAG: amidohydrolase family protein [Burkholderiales bacterium]
MLEILHNPLVKDGNFPIHIHIAEQEKEVEDCLKMRGQRPVEWLLKNIILNQALSIEPKRWVLVHATHMNEEETVLLARSGASVCFCPTTEADLGDGIAPVSIYHKYQGNLSIGSDSNTVINPFVELANLELDQRRLLRRRNILTIKEKEVGEHLYNQALKGGALAIGRKASGIVIGNKADLLVLDANHEFFISLPLRKILSKMIFEYFSKNCIKDVIVAGQFVIKDQRLISSETNEENIMKIYKNTVTYLNNKFEGKELNTKLAPINPTISYQAQIIQFYSHCFKIMNKYNDNPAIEFIAPDDLKGIIDISNKQLSLPLCSNFLSDALIRRSFENLLQEISSDNVIKIAMSGKKAFLPSNTPNEVLEKLKTYAISPEITSFIPNLQEKGIDK